MNQSTITIRHMKAEDFEAIVRIDEKLLGSARPEYNDMKFERLFQSNNILPASLVAEKQDGAVAGFVMGELYMGEFGIFQKQVSLDTIGGNPLQHHGIDERLIAEFVEHLKRLGVKKIYTRVDWNDSRLIQFFSASRFSPSKTINLERLL